MNYRDASFNRKFKASSSQENILSLDTLCLVCGVRYGQYYGFSNSMRCPRDLNKYERDTPDPEDTQGCFSSKDYVCTPSWGDDGTLTLLLSRIELE